MKIIELKSENVKRLKAVSIKPDGTLIQITGKNGAGKSSVLDSIMMALAGKNAIPERPIREGEKRASVKIDLGEYVVERTWTGNDKTYLTVKTKAGASFPSPQAMLDELVGSLSFDPLGFANMRPKEQAEELKKLVGLDFSQLDAKRQEVFSDRTVISRKWKEYTSLLSTYPEPEIDVPSEEVSVSTLLDKHTEAINQTNKNKSMQEILQNRRASYLEVQHDISDMENQIETLRYALKETKTSHSLMESENAAYAKEIDGLEWPNLDDIAKELAEVENTNKAIRQEQDRLKLVKATEQAFKTMSILSEAIGKIDNRKNKELAEAAFPVAGLCFDENGVNYNDLPFDQASSAEQLRVSVAMGLALNPQLRVMLIRDGSLLDKDNLEIIANMAQEADTQVWIEQVSDKNDVGIVIEDGMVKNT